LTPNDLSVVAHLGYALERSGNPEKAAEVLTGLVATVPGSVTARELLAEAQFKQGKRAEALAVVREGLERKPDSPDLLRRLGSLLERSGHAAEAAAAYREYLRLAPQAGDAQAVAAKASSLERGSPPAGGAL
ncbi:MAG TPA: tetratricopeptide repeat protein, partial [Vicinamibacteria bacterium]